MVSYNYLVVLSDLVYFIRRLTACVLRSFVKAELFISIDPENIKETTTWLENKQKPNGCFKQLGKLFDNRIKVTGRSKLKWCHTIR